MALNEAAQPELSEYAAQVVRNAKALAAFLTERGYTLVSGGTDNHLILADLTSQGIGGKPAAQALDRAGIETELQHRAVRQAQALRPVRHQARHPGDRHPRAAQRSTCRRSRPGWTRRSPPRAKEDETAIERIATEVREFLADYPVPGWAAP